jgi:hypothetical protein
LRSPRFLLNVGASYENIRIDNYEKRRR